MIVVITLALFPWFLVQTGASNVTCLVDGTPVPCSQHVCPNARVQVMCVNTETSSSNLWRLPQNTCPAKNPTDAMALTQGSRGVPSSCGTASSTCGAFTAQNNGSDLQTQLCLMSILTFNASSTTSSIQCGSGDVNNNYINPSDVGSVNITITVAPGPTNLVTLVNGGNDTSLTMTWAPPTTGDAPTSYNVSINDIIGTSWITPHDGSPSYIHTFAGLTSNTLYSITVVAINCAGSTGVSANNYTFAVPPSAITGSCGQRGSSNYLNITWLPAVNVTTYQITYFDLDHGENTGIRVEDCLIGPCYATIDLDMEAKHWRICIGSFNQGNILGLLKCQDIDCPHSSSGSFIWPLVGGMLALLIVIIIIVVIVMRKMKRRSNYEQTEDTMIAVE